MSFPLRYTEIKSLDRLLLTSFPEYIHEGVDINEGCGRKTWQAISDQSVKIAPYKDS